MSELIPSGTPAENVAELARVSPEVLQNWVPEVVTENVPELVITSVTPPVDTGYDCAKCGTDLLEGQGWVPVIETRVYERAAELVRDTVLCGACREQRMVEGAKQNIYVSKTMPLAQTLEFVGRLRNRADSAKGRVASILTPKPNHGRMVHDRKKDKRLRDQEIRSRMKGVARSKDEGRKSGGKKD